MWPNLNNMDEPNERTRKDYWEKRVEENQDDLLGMVMVHQHARRHEDLVYGVLNSLGDMSVLDIACGYGRFSRAFSAGKYTGIDFSEKMIELANRLNPGKTFLLNSAHDADLPAADVVFEVISLSSLDLTPIEFFEKYQHLARRMLICFEFDQFYIWYL